jgi:hypothetical protein
MYSREQSFHPIPTPVLSLLQTPTPVQHKIPKDSVSISLAIPETWYVPVGQMSLNGNATRDQSQPCQVILSSSCSDNSSLYSVPTELVLNYHKVSHFFLFNWWMTSLTEFGITSEHQPVTLMYKVLVYIRHDFALSSCPGIGCWLPIREVIARASTLVLLIIGLSK